MGYARSVANFQSTTWNGITVNVNANTQRVLEIATPGNMSGEQVNAIQRATTEAARNGVEIIQRIIK